MWVWARRVLLGLIVLAIGLIVGGFGYEQYSRLNVAEEFPPTGQLLLVDGRNMHLKCVGEGSPTVVFESGFGYDGSSSWYAIQEAIGVDNRACAYDRSGILWSDRINEPVTAAGTADRLHALLTQASEEGPFVLVGHSLGGALTLVYASQYPDDVVGVVLVDSSHPELGTRLPQEVLDVMMPGAVQRLMGLVAAELGLIQLMSPEPYSGMAEAYVAATKYLPRSMVGMMDEADAIPTIMAEAGDVTSLGNRPLLVLSGPNPPRGIPDRITPETIAETLRVMAEMQRELAKLSTNSEHRIIEDSGHYIHHDNPDAVVLAIRDIIQMVNGENN